jgi:hypothetical protein
MSRQSTCSGLEVSRKSSSGSESISPSLPIFFLFVYVLLLGNLSLLALCAAPKTNVNLFFSSSASSFSVYSLSLISFCICYGLSVFCMFVLISSICCDTISIRLFCLASTAFNSNSNFCSIFRRLLRSSPVFWAAFRVRVVRPVVSGACVLVFNSVISVYSFLYASSFVCSLASILVSLWCIWFMVSFSVCFCCIFC